MSKKPNKTKKKPIPKKWHETKKGKIALIVLIVLAALLVISLLMLWIPRLVKPSRDYDPIEGAWMSESGDQIMTFMDGECCTYSLGILDKDIAYDYENNILTLYEDEEGTTSTWGVSFPEEDAMIIEALSGDSIGYTQTFHCYYKP